MIVIEGADGAGKSTLVKWICKEFGLEEGKRRTANRDEIYKTTRQDSFEALHRALICDEPPLVWDRIGFYSDPIYAPLAGRRVTFTDEELAVVNRAKIVLRFPLIVCLPPLEVVKANVESSHQIKLAQDHIEQIYNHYSYLPWGIRYDYTSSSTALVAAHISSYLERRKEREALCS